MATLPVCYCNLSSAWMDAASFKERFSDEFVSAVRKHSKSKDSARAVLVIDNDKEN